MANIRLYKNADRVALISVWETVFPDDPPHNAPDKVIDEMLKVDGLIYVAEQNARIVGGCIAAYDGHRGWLYSVGVLEESRRDGVGQELVRTAIDGLKARGCLKVNLQIRSDNHAVADFYKSLGFDVEDRMSMGMRL